jgi:membrane protease subunit (stomatin/prohibitin family)
MPLFEGHRDRGLQRLFIEMPDQFKGAVVWKWPDQQVVRHSQLNVDLDYQAVFTNLGRVIGVMGPGRHALDDGASLALGWLVDRLTGNAFYDAEVYFVTSRDITAVEFGGPLDNLSDGPSGLVVSVRAFGELAFHVSDPVVLLAKLTGTGAQIGLDEQITEWVKEQAMAGLRSVLPGLVAQHGVLAMGDLQDATAAAALAKANLTLAAYGVAITTFAQLNVNVPDADAHALKQLAATKAYTGVAGSFDSAVRGEAALQIADGIASGRVNGQGIVAGMLMGVPGMTGLAPAAAPAAASNPATRPGTAHAAPAETPAAARFCTACGAPVSAGAHFCAQCGSEV